MIDLLYVMHGRENPTHTEGITSRGKASHQFEMLNRHKVYKWGQDRQERDERNMVDIKVLQFVTLHDPKSTIRRVGSQKFILCIVNLISPIGQQTVVASTSLLPSVPQRDTQRQMYSF